jgi:cytochrome c oxidase subunit 1
MMNEALGWIHFVGSFVCMQGILFPMLILGLHHVNRRLYDGGMQYAHAQPLHPLQVAMSHSAWALALFQLPFIWNLFASLKLGRAVDANPWHATTLEWTAAPTPPLAHGNFEVVPSVYRPAYEYSVPGAPDDYLPQNRAGV